jgi:hypothetical protein
MLNSEPGGAAAAIASAAAACRERVAALPKGTQSASIDEAIAPLLQAIRDSDPRFAFETEGRPGAVEAVRQALPTVERDLFDAVIEDHACEVAALREALRRLAGRP